MRFEAETDQLLEEYEKLLRKILGKAREEL